MKIVKFKKEHVEVAELAGFDKKIFMVPEHLEGLESHLSETFIVNGRIIAFAGLVKVEDTGYVWLVPTKYFNCTCLDFFRTMKKYLKELPKSMGIKKFETNGHRNDTVRRWLKRLGFELKDSETMMYGRDA